MLGARWDCSQDSSCSCLGGPPDRDEGALSLSVCSCDRALTVVFVASVEWDNLCCICWVFGRLVAIQATPCMDVQANRPTPMVAQFPHDGTCTPKRGLLVWPTWALYASLTRGLPVWACMSSLFLGWGRGPVWTLPQQGQAVWANAWKIQGVGSSQKNVIYIINNICIYIHILYIVYI